MTDPRARINSLLWEPRQFACPEWEGQVKGVFETRGKPVLENEVVRLADDKVFITRAWKSDVEGEVVATFYSDRGALPAVVRHHHATLLNFDLAGSVEAMLYERYRREGRPLCTRAPLPYYRWVPRFLRVPIKRGVNMLAGGAQPDAFPMWPKAKGLLGLIEIALEPRPRKWFGHAGVAVALSHDVESAAGIEWAAEVAKIEADNGVVSTWFIVGRLAGQARRLADRLKDAGHEIALHGVEHDMAFPFLSRAAMEKRLDSCRSFIEDYGIVGFRSPALLRSDLMYEVIGERFAYDSSVVDTGRSSPHARPTGCCTVFPFRRSGTVVVPITQPLDAALMFLGYSHGDILGLWANKLRFVRTAGGCAVLDTHPEPHFTGNAMGLTMYDAYLKALSAVRDRWVTTLAGLADYVSPAEATNE